MRKLFAVVSISLFVLTVPADARQISRAEFIEDINIKFLKGDYAGLIRDAEADLNGYRLQRNEKKEVLYLAGLSCIKTEAFAKARDIFGRILELKGNEYREKAYIGIADSYFYEKKFESAIKAYNDALNFYPKTDKKSSIYYNLALSYDAKKDPVRANSYFRKIEEEYNTSFEAEKAVYLPTEIKERYYIVQLGAFRSLRNAKKLTRRLSRKRYESYIQKVERDGEVWYRVRGGKFASKYYAMRLKKRLKKDRFYSAKIIVE